ncbi:MAG: divalent-cation tolerance protein CutA [Nitrososphaerales archaeon]
MDAEYLVVLVTLATADAGVQLGRQLVEERLAACVQVLEGGTAVYRWQGELYVEPQAQLIIKTTAPAWERLRRRIVELHADEVPEILALPVPDGLPAYLSWLSESAGPSAGT